MTDYRLYILRSDHPSRPPEVVACHDDEEAIEKAAQILDGHPIEIWERARLVIRMEPKDKGVD